ncbi:MAG: arginine--tRNA ligase, partial [Spirochaetaceae bacterium]|nr:arginine--tRNA ligase [Spirochaetaceae bacterium]
MADLKERCREVVSSAINKFASDSGLEVSVTPDSLVLETPPKPELGDVGIPMFPFAKVLRMGPPVIAQKIVELIKDVPEALEAGEFLAVGPYENIKLNKAVAISNILNKIESENDSYGSFDENGKKALEGRRVMVEFSSPNTNKPLHLGHLRNDALGESVSRILKAAGADVYKVNIIN